MEQGQPTSRDGRNVEMLQEMGKEVSRTMKFCTTVGVADKMDKSEKFKQFVYNSISRHLKRDWGEISEEDAQANSENPTSALSAYNLDGTKIWIKQDDDIITVLFPDEY